MCQLKKRNLNSVAIREGCNKIALGHNQDMKNLIGELQKQIPGVKTNIYGAIKRSNIKGWNKK